MAGYIDIGRVQQALSVVTSSHATARTLANTAAPNFLQRSAVRAIEEQSIRLDIQLRDAYRAAQDLPGVDPAPLRDARTASQLLQGDARERILAGARAQSVLDDVELQARRQVGTRIDNELADILRTHPAELTKDRSKRLSKLVEATSIRADGGPFQTLTEVPRTRTARITALLDHHLDVVGAGPAQRTERAHELLAGSAPLAPEHAAELRVLLARQDVAPAIPRDLGPIQLDELLSQVLAGAAPESTHRLLQHVRGFATGPRDAEARAAAAIDELISMQASSAAPDELAALLALAPDSASSANVRAAVDVLRRTDPDAADADAARLVLERHALEVEGVAVDAAGTRSELLHALSNTDSSSNFRLRALASAHREAGGELVDWLPGVGTIDDALRAGTPPDSRVVAAWRGQLDDTVTGDAIRRDLNTLVGGRIDELDPAERARVRDLVEAHDVVDPASMLVRSNGLRAALDQFVAGERTIPGVLHRLVAELELGPQHATSADELTARLLREVENDPSARSLARMGVFADAIRGVEPDSVITSRVLGIDDVDAVLRGEFTPDNWRVERIRDLWRSRLSGTFDSEASRGELNDLARLTERTPDQLRRMRQLLVERHAAGMDDPDALKLAEQFDKLAMGTKGTVDEQQLAKLQEATSLAMSTPEHGAARIRELLDIAVADRTKSQDAELARLVRHHGDAFGLSQRLMSADWATGPRNLRNQFNLRNEVLEVYSQMWRAELDGITEDPARLRAALLDVLDKPVDSMTMQDAARVLGLLEAARVPLGLPKTIPGIEDAASHLAQILGKSSNINGATYKLFAALRTALQEIPATEAGHAARIRELLRVPFQELTIDQSAELHALTQTYRGADLLDLSTSWIQGFNHDWTVDRVWNAHLAGLSTMSAEGRKAFQRLLTRWRVDAGVGFGVPESAALRDGKLAAHFIRRNDVPAFLEGSAWKHTLFHGSTNRETHEKILTNGAQVERNKRSAWGQGFYTATTPGAWGDDIMEVAVRLRKPFVTDASRAKSQYQTATGKKWDTNLVRQRLLENGYDGIVIQRPSKLGGDWVVALNNDDVKIVVDQADALVPRPHAASRFQTVATTN